MEMFLILMIGAMAMNPGLVDSGRRFLYNSVHNRI